METLNVLFKQQIQIFKSKDTVLPDDWMPLYQLLDNIGAWAHNDYPMEAVQESIRKEIQKDNNLDSLKATIESLFVSHNFRFEVMSEPVSKVSNLLPSNANFRKYEWEFTCILQSVVYPCINILTDKTFVCLSDDNEIRFITLQPNQIAFKA